MKNIIFLFAMALSCFFGQANAQCTTPVGAFTENFGSTPLGQMPACWNKLFDGSVNGLEKVEVTNTASNSAPNSIVFTGGQGSFGVANGYAVTPQLADLQSGIYSMNFYAKASFATSSFQFHLQVGTMSDPNNPGTFQMVQDITLTTSYQNFIVNFTSPPAGHKYIAFKAVDLFNNYFTYIDDVIWTPPITCPAPSGLAVSGITSTGANLDWAPGATETKWDIEYGTDGFALGSGTLVNDDDAVSDETLSGLSASTAYDFYVRAECAPTDLSFWMGPFSFVTVCVPYNAFTEDFEATAVGSLPICWDVIDNGSATSTWAVGTPGTGVSAHSGAQVAELPQRDLTFGGSSNDYLISPQISVVAGSSDFFEFYARSDDASVPETVNVLLSTTGKAASDFTVTLEGPISVPATWTKYKYNLTAYVGQTIYIAVQATTPPPSGFNTLVLGLYVDDAVLKAVPTCLQPINLTATAITSSTADLGWTDANTTAPNSWDVDIELAGDPQAAPITATGVTANSYPATGLASSTDYVFYVRANCGGGDFSVWSGPFAFTTLCAPYGSFTENFDALPQDVLPDCWAPLIDSSDGNSFVKIDASFSLSAPNNLWMKNFSDVNANIFAITPVLTDLANGTHQLRFFARGDINRPADAIEVGTMTDPANIATYTMIQSFSITETYQEFIVRFDTPITDTYIAIRGVFDDTHQDIRIDDVFWEPIPPCVKPDNLGVISLEDTSANLDWDETGTATAWSIEYGAAGFSQATAGTIVSDTDGASDEIITGLVASTNYEFYVRADCGGTAGSSIWKGPFPFTTLCAPSALPFTENFAVVATPTCWIESGDTGWNYSTGADNASDHTIVGGTNYAWVSGSALDDGQTTTLASPLVDVSTLTTPALEFYIFSQAQGGGIFGGGSGFTKINMLDVDFYDGASWNNAVHLVNPIGNDWRRFLIDLSVYTITDDVRVRFTVTAVRNHVNPQDNAFNDISVDDVSFMEMPLCPTPGALTASNITQTAADLGWTEFGTANTWDIELGAAGFAPTGTPTSNNVTSNPYNISTLTACKSYEFYVRADCGSGTLSNWAGPFQFSTQAGTVGSFSENFDALPTGTIPTCWNSIVTGGAGQSSVQTSTSNSHSTPNSLRLYHGFYSVASTMYAVTPELSDLQGGAYQIRFFAAQTGGATLEVGTMSDPTNETTFHLVNTIAVTSAYAEYIVPFRLPQTGHKYVAFKVNTTTAYEGIDIDDVIWEPKPLCKKPDNLTATNIGQTTADLGWTDTNFPVATTWDVDIELAGTPQAAPITATGTTSNPYPASGLTAGTEYEFYVRTDCGGGDLSAWSGPFAFTTDCAPSGSFTENFDSYPIGTLPICWGKIVNSASTFATVEIEDFSSYSAPNQLRMYNFNDVAAELFAVLPEVSDLPNGTHQLRFFVRGGTGMTLEVGTMSDPANESTFTSVQLVPTTGSYQEVIIPFASVGTDTYVAFRATYAATLKNIIIDDVFWEPIPSCPKPSNLNASGILGNSADLGWTDNAGASKWDLYVVASGTAAPTGATTPTDNDVTANPYHKTNLTPQADYEYYVRSVCGPGDMSVWVGPFAFSTPCATKVAPWNDDVEAHTKTPESNLIGFAESNCWTATASTADGYAWYVGNANTPSGQTGPSGAHSGTNFFYVEDSSPAQAGDVAILYAPNVDVSGLTSPALVFYYHMYGVEMGNLYIEVFDGTTWVVEASILGQQQTSDTDPWLKKTVDLSAYSGVVEVRFRAVSTGPYRGDISLDDISFENLANYVYTGGTWIPSDPSGASTSGDDIAVLDGTATLTAATLMNNLTVYAGATLKAEAVLSPSGDIHNDGSLIFVSDGTDLGQLNDMTGSVIDGSGNVTIQRYISLGRAYRPLSPAVSTTTSINANWQEGVHNTGTNYPADNLNPNPGFGTHITGSTTGANGFDATQIGFHSLYEFDAANQAWVAVTNTDVNTLGAGEALLLYVRGDRGINLGSTANPPPTSSTILRTTGDLQVGNYTDNTLSTTAGEFSFVGNPYQAIVNMNDVLANSTNLNTSYYYVWDPNLSTYGAYVLVSLPGGTPTPSASAANEFLQPGQAAFVSTLATGPTTFLVEQADKDVTQAPTDVFKPQATASIALELYEAGTFAKGGAPADGFLVNFRPGGNNGVDPKDVPKPMNFDENVGLANGTSLLIMENRGMPTQSDVLPLYNDNYRHTDYVYQIQVNGLAQTTPVLTDAYLGTQSPLQKGLNTIVFSVDASVAASVAPDRFSISFQKKLSTGEVSITGFELYPNPVKGGFFFVLASGTAGQDLQVSIYDLLGRKVYGARMEVGSDDRIQVNAQGLQAGAYMIKLETEGKSFVQKLIVSPL